MNNNQNNTDNDQQQLRRNLNNIEDELQNEEESEIQRVISESFNSNPSNVNPIDPNNLINRNDNIVRAIGQLLDMRRAAQRDLVKFKKSRSFVNFSHIDFFFSLEFLKSTMVSIVLIISSLIGIAYFQIESFSIEELEKNNHNFLFQMILSLSVCLQWTFFLCLNYYMFGKFYHSKLNLNLSETILMSPLTSIGQILLK